MTNDSKETALVEVVPIEQLPAKFNPVDARIAELRSAYMALTVAGVDDKAGLAKVHEARMEIKGHRVNVEKTRKALKEGALAYGRAVDAEAKRLTGLLEPIEEHLVKQEEAIEAEKQRIKAEAERAKKAKLDARVAAIVALKMQPPELSVLEAMTDAEFDEKMVAAKARFEQKQREEEEAAAAKKAEEERVAREQQAERERLAAEKAELERQQAELKRQQEEAAAAKRKQDEEAAAERKRLDDERRKLEEEKAAKARAEELEKAKKEAAAKAKKEAEEKAAREKAAAEEKERKRKEAEARKEARRPDVEKLTRFAKSLDELELPQVAEPAATELGRIIANAVVAVRALAEKHGS